MTVNRDKLMGHLSILLAMVIFGMNGPISKELLSLGGISPWVHVFVRFLGATLLFWLCTPFVKAPEMERKDFWRFLGAAMCVIVINLCCFAFAISITSAVDQSLIATIGPIVTMILAAIYLKEPITKLKAFGVLVGSAGVLVLVLGGHQTGGESNIWGALLSLFATVGYSMYLTLFKPLIEKYHPVVLMKWMFLLSTIVVLPFGLPQTLSTDWGAFSASFLWQLAFVVVLSTFVAYLLVPISQKRIRPTVVSMYNYMMPLIATIAALLLGQEQPSLLKGVAALLVIIGVYMVTASKSRAAIVKEKRTAKSDL